MKHQDQDTATTGHEVHRTAMHSPHAAMGTAGTPIERGVRTTTESDAPDLVAQLQSHVSSMYRHLDQHAEVTCMSSSLPTLFRNSAGYRRELTYAAKGVVVTETSSDPQLTNTIRAHAQEVSRFVRDGMPAMMRGMMNK